MDSTHLVRALASLAIFLPSGLLAAEVADKYSLETRRRLGDMARVEITFQVGGNVKLVTDGKDKDLPMSVVANLDYRERVLALDSQSRTTRSARYYEAAQAVIKVDRG